MPTLPHQAGAWAESFGSDAARTFSAVYRRALSDWDPWARAPLDAYGAIVTRAADGMRAAGFAEPERWRYDWGRAYTRVAWLEALLGGLAAALDDRFTMPYAAVAISAITRET